MGHWFLWLRLTLLPYLPNTVRTRFGNLLMVRLLRAAAAAFLMFLRAARLCRVVAMVLLPPRLRLPHSA